MLRAKAVKNVDKFKCVVYTPRIENFENGKVIWQDDLPCDYVYREDALLIAEREIELLLEQFKK